MSEPRSIQALIDEVRRGLAIAGDITLRLGRCVIRVESDSTELLARLSEYFRFFRAADAPEAEIVVTAIERTPPDFGLTFSDWPRDPGKVGRKDAYADLRGGRVVHKVRTGMQFLIARGVRIAVGPCLANDNQVINFVNSQYMMWLLDREWLLCHAAAIEHEGRGLAMAGFSGAGKSTLALHLLSTGLSYTSNDRLLITREDSVVRASGVPKLPRINPGTALNNPNLTGILSPERRAELADLEEDELWDLEEKYDVDVEEAFDETKFRLTSDLCGFIVLNWKRNGEPARARVVSPAERRDLLVAIKKPAGPFHASGTPVPLVDMDDAPYIDALSRVPLIEVDGGVDFDAAVAMARRLLVDGEAPA